MKLWKYILKNYLWYVLLFFGAKIIFVSLNFDSLKQAANQLIPIFYNGLALDLSAVSYILLIPFILLLISESTGILKALRYYHIVIGLLISCIAITDALVYKYWGGKLSFLLVQYLAEPLKGIRSIASLDLAISAILLIAAVLLIRLYNLKTISVHRGPWWQALLIAAVILFLGRGGLAKTPIGISSSFYHTEDLYNYAALNPLWNLVSYEINGASLKTLELISSEDETGLIAEWRSMGAESISEIHWNDSSRIIVIMLESFSGKLSALRDDKGQSYTPNLDRLRVQGLNYSQAYAASFRSDRGLTAILTGTPSFATQSLTNEPNLLRKAPNLITLFNAAGWHTSMYHGGSLNLANMRLLVTAADELHEQNYFKGSEGSWGVHDEFVFRQFADDLHKTKSKGLHILFSLSSHEPFDVPQYEKHQDAYLNSISYTDSCLGVLISDLKSSGLWSNSLLLISADHGTILPERSTAHKKKNYHIPLILSGGLINDSFDVDQVVSQMDIATTLASAISADSLFVFGHSLLKPAGMAFYNYYHGVVCVTDSCTQYYDIPLQKYLGQQCLPPYEKAYFQAANKQIFAP